VALQIEHAKPLFAARARELGLATATTAVFPSMGRAPDDKGGTTRRASSTAIERAAVITRLSARDHRPARRTRLFR